MSDHDRDLQSFASRFPEMVAVQLDPRAKPEHAERFVTTTHAMLAAGIYPTRTTCQCDTDLVDRWCGRECRDPQHSYQAELFLFLLLSHLPLLQRPLTGLGYHRLNGTGTLRPALFSRFVSILNHQRALEGEACIDAPFADYDRVCRRDALIERGITVRQAQETVEDVEANWDKQVLVDVGLQRGESEPAAAKPGSCNVM